MDPHIRIATHESIQGQQFPQSMGSPHMPVQMMPQMNGGGHQLMTNSPGIGTPMQQLPQQIQSSFYPPQQQLQVQQQMTRQALPQQQFSAGPPPQIQSQREGATIIGGGGGVVQQQLPPQFASGHPQMQFAQGHPQPPPHYTQGGAHPHPQQFAQPAGIIQQQQMPFTGQLPPQQHHLQQEQQPQRIFIQQEGGMAHGDHPQILQTPPGYQITQRPPQQQLQMPPQHIQQQQPPPQHIQQQQPPYYQQQVAVDHSQMNEFQVAATVVDPRQPYHQQIQQQSPPPPAGQPPRHHYQQGHPQRYPSTDSVPFSAPTARPTSSGSIRSVGFSHQQQQESQMILRPSSSHSMNQGFQTAKTTTTTAAQPNAHNSNPAYEQHKHIHQQQMQQLQQIKMNASRQGSAPLFQPPSSQLAQKRQAVPPPPPQFVPSSYSRNDDVEAKLRLVLEENKQLIEENEYYKQYLRAQPEDIQRFHDVQQELESVRNQLDQVKTNLTLQASEATMWAKREQEVSERCRGLYEDLKQTNEKYSSQQSSLQQEFVGTINALEEASRLQQRQIQELNACLLVYKDAMRNHQIPLGETATHNRKSSSVSAAVSEPRSQQSTEEVAQRILQSYQKERSEIKKRSPANSQRSVSPLGNKENKESTAAVSDWKEQYNRLSQKLHSLTLNADKKTV